MERTMKRMRKALIMGTIDEERAEMSLRSSRSRPKSRTT
jgi:hypothetical protein